EAASAGEARPRGSPRPREPRPRARNRFRPGALRASGIRRAGLEYSCAPAYPLMGRMTPEVRQVFANRCTDTPHTASMLIQTFLPSEEMISLSVADGRIAAVTSSSFG